MCIGILINNIEHQGKEMNHAWFCFKDIGRSAALVNELRRHSDISYKNQDFKLLSIRKEIIER